MLNCFGCRPISNLSPTELVDPSIALTEATATTIATGSDNVMGVVHLTSEFVFSTESPFSLLPNTCYIIENEDLNPTLHNLYKWLPTYAESLPNHVKSAIVISKIREAFKILTQGQLFVHEIATNASEITVGLRERITLIISNGEIDVFLKRRLLS